MTPQEALDVLDSAASLAALSRIQHVQVQNAVKELQKLITAQDEPDK